ncbi:MAG: DNA-directed DNA polymerase, partial [Sphingopyxis sp.]|nr:DNA-directed DNA polymerase [Sphingopyxis sp.]
EALAREVAGVAGRDRFRLLLDLAPRILLRIGRERGGAGSAELLAAWDQVQAIGRTALSGSYDPTMVAFEIGNSFAALGGSAAGGAASPSRA